MVSEQEACLLHVLMLKGPSQLNKHNTGWIVLQVDWLTQFMWNIRMKGFQNDVKIVSWQMVCERLTFVPPLWQYNKIRMEGGNQYLDP